MFDHSEVCATQVLRTDKQTGSAAECAVTQSKNSSYAEQQPTSCTKAASADAQQLVLDLEDQPATVIHHVRKLDIAPTQQESYSSLSASAVQLDLQAVPEQPAANLQETTAAHFASIGQHSSHSKAAENGQQGEDLATVAFSLQFMPVHC